MLSTYSPSIERRTLDDNGNSRILITKLSKNVLYNRDRDTSSNHVSIRLIARNRYDSYRFKTY